LEKFITPKESWNPVDKALFSSNSFFSDYKNIQELMVEAVRYSFKHHFDNNVIYHKVCEVKGVTPEDIKSKNDFNKIPLVPDTFFKDYPEDKGFLNWLKTIFTGSIPNVDFKTNSPSHDEIIEKFNNIVL
jgi:phenylacetate-coenzyme A ligase PaaK-like adenylate-forming protein